MPKSFPEWYADLNKLLVEAPEGAKYLCAVVDNDNVGVNYRICCETCAEVLLRESFHEIFLAEDAIPSADNANATVVERMKRQH